MNRDQKDYADLKDFARKKRSGSENGAAAWTLLHGFLWSLEVQISPILIEDMLALARFEHARKLAEGK